MLTAEPSESRLSGNTFLGIGVSTGAIVLVGGACAAFGLNALITGALTSAAASIPAAIEYRLQAKRRDKNEDTARIQQGVLRRPIGLVIGMFIGALLLIDTVGGGFMGGLGAFIALAGFDPSAGAIFLLGFCGALVVGVAIFPLASFTSHYLGKNPYVWIAFAVCVVFLIRLMIVGTVHGLSARSVFSNVVTYLIYLVACLGGTWFGRKRHDKFLANKLARIQMPVSNSVAAPRQFPPSVPSPPMQMRPPNARDRRLE
jgi:hypothetical protein